MSTFSQKQKYTASKQTGSTFELNTTQCETQQTWSELTVHSFTSGHLTQANW